MKKILFGIIIITILIGCGKKYKTYSLEEKYNMIVKLEEIEMKTDLTKEEENFKKEIRDLLSTLKIESEKDLDAKKEFDEWRDTVIKFEQEEIKKMKEKEKAEKSSFKISF